MKLSPKKVLIVEDDNLLLMVAKRLVQKIGHDVVATVDNGRGAISAIEENELDVVLMDIRLNGDMDGIETVQEIKKISSVPVIYLSGSSYSKSFVRARKIGYSAFLQKPLQVHELKEAFQKIFAGKKRFILKPRKRWFSYK